MQATNAQTQKPTAITATPVEETSSPTPAEPPNIPSSIALAELHDLGINLEVTLEFSLWFPEHRASELDINGAEDGVLISLEALFCNTGNTAFTFESFDDLCVLYEHILGSNVAVVRSSRQDGHDEDPEATIVMAPYVIYLEERYRYVRDGQFSWTTWKVSFEIFQLGRSVVESAIAALGVESEFSSEEEIYMSSARAIQNGLKRTMDANMQDGSFDSILASHVVGMQVFSSPLDEELETFGFLDWNYPNVIPSPRYANANANRDKMIIATIASLAFLVSLAVGAYISLNRRRARAAWMKERERHIMRSDERDIVKQEQPVRRSTPGDASTMTNMKGSLVPAEIDLMEDDATPISQPTMDERKVEGTSDREDDRDDDRESGVSGSLDLAWSLEGVDAPWRPWPRA